MTGCLAIHLRVHEIGVIFMGLARALTYSLDYTAQVPPERVEDEFDRFKIWAGNIAAHHKDRRSLEYRLRDATHLRDETNALLSALEHSLNRALSIVQGEEVPWDAFPKDNEMSDTDSDGDSDVASNSNSSSDLEEDTELKQLHESIKTSVTCLFRLSMAIRDPAPDHRRNGTRTIDKTHFEEHDILHTTIKFPECAEFLRERLGRAISGRRQYFSYREQHHQKLAMDAEMIGFEQARTEYSNNGTGVTQLSAATRSSVADGCEDDAASETSYATSVNDTIRVPRMPREARGQSHFECPLCYRIVNIDTEAAWKKHVYRDLYPYSCTFEQCPMADHLYDSRHTWFQHELQAHRSSWRCIEGCDDHFTMENDLDYHITQHHPELVSLDMLKALKRSARTCTDLSSQDNCSICGARMTIRALERHVGRHQEQLALFALPSHVQGDEKPADDEDPLSGGSDDLREDTKLEAEQVTPQHGLPSQVGCVYACPFYQTDPHDPRLSRSCRHPFTMSRLREHLIGKNRGSRKIATWHEGERYGPHTKPECENCLHVFTSDHDLREHEKFPCSRNEPLYPNKWVGKRVAKLIAPLPRRPRSEDAVNRNEELWQGWYTELFGKDALKPSCYFSEADLAPVNASLLEKNPQSASGWPTIFSSDNRRTHEQDSTTETHSLPKLATKETKTSVSISDDTIKSRYCYCNRISYGTMIRCENYACPRELFHISCLKPDNVPPLKGKWFCSDECKESKHKDNVGWIERPGGSLEKALDDLMDRNFPSRR